MPAPLENLDTDYIIEQYTANVSEQAIAKAIGVSRSVIRRIITKAGITPRNSSQSAFIRMANTSPAERKALASAAHDARRGQTDSLEVRMKRAMHMSECRVGMFELELIQALSEIGVTARNQEPMGRYNLDVFIESYTVAVEIYSSHPETYRMPYLKERSKYLLDMGFSVLIIQCNYPKRVFNLADVRDKVVAFCDYTRSNKSAIGHYGVIKGDAKIPPTSSHYMDDFPAVVAF